MSDLLKQNKSPRKKKKPNLFALRCAVVLLLSSFFFPLCGHLFFTCLVADQTELSLEPCKRACKCSGSLWLCPSSSARFLQCLAVSTVQSWVLISEKSPRWMHLLQLPSFPGDPCNCGLLRCLWGCARSVSCLPLARTGSSWASAPPESNTRFFEAPNSSQTTPRNQQISGPELSHSLLPSSWPALLMEGFGTPGEPWNSLVLLSSHVRQAAA